MTTDADAFRDVEQFLDHHFSSLKRTFLSVEPAILWGTLSNPDMGLAALPVVLNRANNATGLERNQHLFSLVALCLNVMLGFEVRGLHDDSSHPN